MNAQPQNPELTPEQQYARSLVESYLDQGYKPAGLYRWCDTAGNLLFWRVRVKHPSTGEKQFRPFYHDKDRGIFVAREPRFPPGQKPLYGQERLAGKPDAPVFIVEGENCVDSLAKIGVVAVTSGGATSAKGADWSPLRGRSALIWPDNDDQGQKYATEVAAILSGMGCPVSILDVTALGLAEKGDCVNYLANNPDTTVSALQTLPTTSTPTLPKDSDQPPKPVPFDALDLPPLDPANLPPPLRAMAEGLAVSLQIPADLAVMGTIAAVAVADRGKYEVRVREGYVEPLNLYVMACLEPSSLKSPTMKALKSPFIEWQKQKNDEEGPGIAAADSQRKTLEAAIKAKRAKAGSLPSDKLDDLTQEIIDLEKGLPEVPRKTRLFFDDATPEAAAAVLAASGGVAAVMEAEGGILDTIAGRYSNGTPNLDLFLKGYSREPVFIDRKGQEQICLQAPQLTLFLAPQPACLMDRRAGNIFRGRGLDARFLYCLPQSLAGTRNVDTMPLPKSVKEGYRQTIHRILNAPPACDDNGNPVPHILTLSDAAYAVWKEFAEEAERQLGEGGDLAGMPDWGGKLKGQLVRIAGCLHLASHDIPQVVPIQETTMKAATALCAVLVDHAKAAYGLMETVPEVETGKKIWRWLERRNLERFTARDAFQAIKGPHTLMEEVEFGLKVLSDRALILPVAEEPRQSRTGRHPSPAFVVNREGIS